MSNHFNPTEFLKQFKKLFAELSHQCLILPDVKKVFSAILFFVFFAGILSASAQPIASGGLLASEAINVRATEPFYLEDSVASMPFLTDTDPFGTSLRVISALFAVIILALILSWIIQRKGVFSGNVFGRVLGILPLDNRRFIYVVDVVGKILVLGVTESNINLLSEIDDKTMVDSLRLQGEQGPGLEKIFSFLKKSNPSPEAEGGNGDEISNTEIRTQTEKNHERLRKLSSLLIKRGSDDNQK